MAALTLVRSAEDVLENVRRFSGELEGSVGLQERMSLVHAWYAVREPSGWAFAPSKFVGYRKNTASQYLRTATIEDGAHGGKTEAALKSWFEPVDLGTSLGRELSSHLADFLARRNLLPRKSFRINVLSTELDKLSGAGTASRRGSQEFLSRIASNPKVCSGRPCIKGTRMRVSDLVDMLAQGATTEEIVEDFPYITGEDISAALAFAARSVDHRVIRAA